MAYFLLYRKPAHMDHWPWREIFKTATDAMDFIKSQGPEYEFRVFSEIDLSDLEDLAEDEVP